MSINEITHTDLLRPVQFNQSRAPEIAAEIKATSDAKGDTNDLTYGTGSSPQSSHGIGYKGVREYKERLEIKKIITQTDEDYFLELGSDF